MATMGDDALFVDTNVLVHANVAEAPLHGVALNAITQAQSNGRDLWIRDSSRRGRRSYTGPPVVGGPPPGRWSVEEASGRTTPDH